MNGEISFSDLASSVGINQSALTRILRLAIAHRIFLEHRPGFIAHSAASRQIADDACVASWVSAGVDEMWPAAVNMVPALEKWPKQPSRIKQYRANPIPLHTKLINSGLLPGKQY
jgi:hypothetical protein